MLADIIFAPDYGFNHLRKDIVREMMRL